MVALGTLGALAGVVVGLAGGDAQKPTARVFSYRQAEQARLVAQRECKPLVIHFIPDTKLGGQQFEAFYRGPDAVPASVLEDVVIVAVPTRKFAGLARRLGITGLGGYRTISAYDLSPMENQAQATCRTGFI